MSKRNSGATIVTAGIGAVVLGLMALAVILGIGAAVLTGLIYLLFNILLPVVGVVYPLTWGQCFAGAAIVMIVKAIIGSVFKSSS